MEVDTMSTALTKQPGLAAVQQRVADGVKGVQGSGRKLLLAYVGLWGVAYDSVAGIFQSGIKLLDTAEDRGARMSSAFSERFLRIERQVGENIEQVKLTVYETRGETQEDLERSVEMMLASLGVPSRERLERLSMEIDELNARLDEELLKAV
jgi:poly(hydroxyalkanoate) granule-associated protein